MAFDFRTHPKSIRRRYQEGLSSSFSSFSCISVLLILSFSFLPHLQLVSSSSSSSNHRLLEFSSEIEGEGSDDNDFCSSPYEAICSPSVILQIQLNGNYFDLDYCSALHYAPGCAAGFFQLPSTSSFVAFSSPPLLFSATPPTKSPQSSSSLSTLFSSSWLASCPGFYSPEGAVCLIPCSPGGFCPSPSTLNSEQPYLCDPYSSFWRPGLGCGGAPVDFPCLEGTYCPNPGHPSIPCPSGSYCPRGVSQPEKCPLLARCPEGSSVPQINFLGIAGLLLVTVLVLGTVHLGKFVNASRFQGFYKSWIKRQPDLELQLMKGEQEGEGRDEVQSSPSVSLHDSSSLPPLEFRMDIGVQGLGFKHRGEREKLLTNIDADIKAGRMMAVMGPSGAGKTTFLSALAGKATHGIVTGRFSVNGEERRDFLQRYREIVAYVPQEDVMHSNLTVFENLAFNANWRLPNSMSSGEKMDIVFKVLEVLGLGPSVSNRCISEVSGGQRKRVNIGMELVANPSVLLADEPTSGLDSSTTFEVLDVFQKVAASGVNVVVVLHQPRYEVMSMFDDLLLLAPGGRTAYMGTMKNALPYFTHELGYVLPSLTNPADLFLDVVSGRLGPPLELPAERRQSTNQEEEEGGRAPLLLSSLRQSKTEIISSICERWETRRKEAVEEDSEDGRLSSPSFSSYPQERARYKPRTQGSFFKQCYYCTARALTQRSRQLGVLFSDSVLMCLAGLVLGLLFRGVALTRVPNVNLFISMSIGFAATQASLRLFGEERVVFWRESSVGLNRIAYFLGKNVASLPEILLHPFMFLSLFYFISGPRASFGAYYFVLLVNQFALAGIGQFISVVLEPSKAQMAAVVMTLILNAISGFTPQLKDMGQLGFICSFTYARWLLETLWLVESKHFSAIFDPVKREIANKFSYQFGTEEKEENQVVFCLWIIFLQGTLLRIATSIALFLFNRDKQK